MSSTASGPAQTSPILPWSADHIELWPIERLIPYANNPRLHREADLDKIAASTRKWGWTHPPPVDEDGVVIAGHGRVAAAGTRPAGNTGPVSVARGRTEGEQQAYRIADNEPA